MLLFKPIVQLLGVLMYFLSKNNSLEAVTRWDIMQCCIILIGIEIYYLLYKIYMATKKDTKGGK